MASGLYTSSHDWQNEYTAHLSADVGSSDTDIFLDSVPTPTEGCLVIDPDTPANTEIIFYTSKTSSKVTVPSVANGRGYDSTTATTHTSGTKVIMAPIADDFRYIRTVATTTPQGWTPVASAPNTVVANGNRSYTCTFNAVDYTSILSAGMRIRTTRTVAAPTQSTSLNGTTQFWSKTAPAGMTFTNNFVVSAWVKLNAYSAQRIVSRWDGASGWVLELSAAGQVNLFGNNGGASNFSQVQSYQSIPLNKWVHIAAQLDMATFTATPTTSYVMIDGLDVPAAVTRGGTNPTALVQAGNLNIGAANALTFFNGKIDQAAIYSAKVTQATILASISQGLAGTETSLISAYSFNGTANDLNTTNANNLTANGSAVATNADSPFGGQASGLISSTLDYGILQSVTFSTNTTVVVQVPEGCTIPTSGGVSAVVYSSNAVPYGFPKQRGKWRIEMYNYTLGQQNAAVISTWYNISSPQLTVPIGEWSLSYNVSGELGTAAAATLNVKTTLSDSATTESDKRLTVVSEISTSTSSTTSVTVSAASEASYTATSQTIKYLNTAWQNGGASAILYNRGDYSATVIRAENAYL